MANQALQNLKRIHELQKEGEISKLLQTLRSSKAQVDDLGRTLAKRLKEIDVEIAQKKQAEKAREEQAREEAVKVDVVETKKATTAASKTTTTKKTTKKTTK